MDTSNLATNAAYNLSASDTADGTLASPTSPDAEVHAQVVNGNNAAGAFGVSSGSEQDASAVMGGSVKTVRKVPIGPASILLRGCSLRNTSRIFGLVIYAGVVHKWGLGWAWRRLSGGRGGYVAGGLLRLWAPASVLSTYQPTAWCERHTLPLFRIHSQSVAPSHPAASILRRPRHQDLHEQHQAAQQALLCRAARGHHHLLHVCAALQHVHHRLHLLCHLDQEQHGRPLVGSSGLCGMLAGGFGGDSRCAGVHACMQQ